MNPAGQQTAGETTEAPPEEEVVQQPLSAADLEVEKPEKAQASLLDQIVDQMDAKQRERLVELELEAREFFHNQRIGKMFAASGYFKDVRNVAQAATKIEMGKSWKMNVANSMRYIYWINQRPAVMEEYMQAELTRKGWGFVPHFPGGTGRGCKGCHIAILFKGETYLVPVITDEGKVKFDENGQIIKEPLVVSFTEDDALGVTIWENKQRVSLLKKKGPWSDGFRADMYFNRALSRFRRRYDADVLSGALTRDEASDIQEDDENPATETPAVLTAIAEAMKAPAKPKAEPAKEATKPAAAPAAAKPADPKPAPAAASSAPKQTTIPTPRLGTATLKDFAKMEALLGSKLFTDVLRQFDFASVGDILNENQAAAILDAMMKATKKEN